MFLKLVRIVSAYRNGDRGSLQECTILIYNCYIGGVGVIRK